MSNQATLEDIEKCATLLFKCGYPRMPLTHDKKTPFDISKMYNNDTYNCIKIFLTKHKFSKLNPVLISFQKEAKRKYLKVLTSPGIIQKIQTRFKSGTNADSYEHDGLFLIYQTTNMRTNSNEEYGLWFILVDE